MTSRCPSGRLPQKRNAHKHNQGPSNADGAQMRIEMIVPPLPRFLLSSAAGYDAEHPIADQPQGFVSIEGHMGSVKKIACSRCGEPRRHDALVDGVCRYKRKCDQAIRDVEALASD